MKAGSVLISGAGIAGPALACWLNAAGFKTTIVERATAPRKGGYVIDFWGLGYDIAERMGLMNDIRRAGYFMRELRIVDGRGARLAGFGARVISELTGGRFVTLARSDLSRLIIEAIEGETEVMYGDEIVELQDDSDGVRIQFRRAGAAVFDLVIGADGLHSNVRRLVFGPQERFEMRLGYVVAAFETRGYQPRDEDVYVIHGEPGQMVGRVALREDRTLFLFVFAADGEDSNVADPEAQKAILRRRYGSGTWECAAILDRLDDAADLYFDRVDQIRMERWSRGRVALVGDAAFCVSLMAGQGSALAIAAAYVLAGELASAGGRHGEAFGRYETRLRDFIAFKQRGARRFSAALAPKTALGLLARNGIIRALAFPGLARVALRRQIADNLDLPDYDWPALGSRANPVAGRPS